MNPGLKEAGKIIASTLSNFAVVSFGLGLYEQNALGLITGVYSLVLAVVIAWRLER